MHLSAAHSDSACVCDTILKLLAEKPNTSIADLAKSMIESEGNAWRQADGKPAKSKMQRRLESLAARELVEKDAVSSKYCITDKGSKILKQQ